MANSTGNTPNVRRRNFRHFYETWEYNYFEYLIEMRNIFASRFLEFYPEESKYIYSEEFFHKFAKFIYSQSSTRIPPTLKPVSSYAEEEYSKYLFKKEELE